MRVVRDAMPAPSTESESIQLKKELQDLEALLSVKQGLIGAHVLAEEEVARARAHNVSAAAEASEAAAAEKIAELHFHKTEAEVAMHRERLASAESAFAMEQDLLDEAMRVLDESTARVQALQPLDGHEDVMNKWYNLRQARQALGEIRMRVTTLLDASGLSDKYLPPVPIVASQFWRDTLV